MNKWYWWALGGAIAAIGAFFYISSKRKGGAPDQLAAARQARLDKLANEKAAADEPSPEAAA